LIVLLTVVMAVSPMHEDVHERTRQQWKPNQEPEHMCPVLSEQQRAGDYQKSDQHQSGLGFHGHARSRPSLMPKVILRRH
jgi:hypothetical protein